ncbi:hypothetical protein SCHPADRAFT_331064 [Schizopora paradoxa]|uniref:Uncharacterized protein n=1 Tax=Schizopora paradoxa TaxID=27342 RepID=A0A0H2SB01_9AGAM|nr:hypothetical protein SCHPADRAFT_331064 [Schizopora paradoxa]
MTRHPRCAAVHEEETEDFETMHVGEAVLKNIFDTLKRLRRRKGCLGSQDDWFERVCPSYSVKLFYDPAQAVADKAALGRAIRTRDVLKSSADALSKIQNQIARQLRNCEYDIEAYKRR